MDLSRIEALIEVVKDAAVTELTVAQDGARVVVKKPLKAATPAAPKKKAPRKEAAAEPVVEHNPNEVIVHAPMVGIFHCIEGVHEGTAVKKSQVVGAIESMKLMNEIKSSEEGKILEIYVDDGIPVEYGQALCRLQKGQG